MASTISIDQDIQPLSEFRKNTASFIERLRKNKSTIVLTQHGKSAAVLINVSTYQNMIDKIELMEELMEAERQIMRGETVPHEEAKRELLANLDKWT